MKIDFPQLPQSTEIQREAIEILINRMGITKAVIFLGDRFWQPTDYLKTKEQLFGDKTVDELYQDITEWRQTNR